MVVIFYVLIFIEISKKSGIFAIDDDAPSWIVTEGCSYRYRYAKIVAFRKNVHQNGKFPGYE
jgi:hypothetical protein